MCSACNFIRKSPAISESRSWRTSVPSESLAKRIIACLDVHAGRVVKGIQFVNCATLAIPPNWRWRTARRAPTRSCCSTSRRPPSRGTHCSIPCAAPPTSSSFRSRWAAAFARSTMRPRFWIAAPTRSRSTPPPSPIPTLITKIAERYGSQAVVVAIDARRARRCLGGVCVGRTKARPGRDAQAWATRPSSWGAGEIMLTSMDRDGTKSGFDCELTRTIATSVRIPVIASGGAGEPRHFVEVFQQGAADAALAASVFHFGLESVHAIKQELLRCRSSGEADMLIPSIDLMGGKIVQLVQGEKKALEFEDFREWVERFSRYPAGAIGGSGRGDGYGFESQARRRILRQAAVPGGRRHSLQRRCAGSAGVRAQRKSSSALSLAQEIGASQTSAFAEALCEQFGTDRLVFAVDSRGGRVAIHGWKTITEIEPAAMMQQLEPFCSAFLYTHIDTEGLLQGIPMDVIRELRGRPRASSSRPEAFAAGKRLKNSTKLASTRSWEWRFTPDCSRSSRSLSQTRLAAANHRRTHLGFRVASLRRRLQNG